MTSLREEVLIEKGFLYFLLPSIVMGIFGAFFPGIYSIIPVHESDICLCSFFGKTDKNNYLLLNKGSNFEVYQIVNSIAFYVINWVFLVVLIWMIYKIRNINDDTSIKRECAWIVGIWTTLSILQYVTFLIQTKDECYGVQNS
jgi:hypothetical protein